MHRRSLLTALLVSSLLVVQPSAQAPAKHFLWSVTDAKGAVVYLMGSIHVLTPDFYPLSPELEKAFDASKVLVEELDLDELNNPAALLPVLAKAMYTDGRTLEQNVSASTFAEVTRRAEKAGLPMMALQRMKPWMAAEAMTLPALQAAGFDPALGVDKHFFDKAKAAGKELRALETVAYQLGRFDQLTPAMQEAMLNQTMAELDTQVTSVKEVATAWAAGDTATIERLLLKDMLTSPELYQALLVERNQNWIAPIEACLQQNAGCLVVVGAAHLIGPDGVPTLLQKKGYTVKQQ
ncbi:MAG: TraB/GumN family protein [Vicinamibacterales bacterium]